MEVFMLNRKKFFAQCAFIIILTVIVSACGKRTTPEPTIDVHQIAAKSVPTLEARATETALANRLILHSPPIRRSPTHLPLHRSQFLCRLPVPGMLFLQQWQPWQSPPEQLLQQRYP